MGTAIAVGYAGGLWQDVSPTWLVGRNIGVHGFYLGRLIGRNPESVARAARTSSASGKEGRSDRSSGQSSRSSRRGRRTADRESAVDGKVVLVP